jgi:hypothetical protein
MVLLSLRLACLFGSMWLLMTAFAGLDLSQAGVTGFCPAAMVFKRLGLKPGLAFSQSE